MIYFDTAYVIKCYLKERGWEAVRDLARSHERVACSAYGRLELHAALHRKRREGAITEQHMEIVLRQLRMDESTRLWEWVPLSAAIMTAVADAFRSLSPRVFLRTGDAVHLISARERGFTEVHSNDRHLIAAAPYVGMTGRDVIPR